MVFESPGPSAGSAAPLAPGAPRDNGLASRLGSTGTPLDNGIRAWAEPALGRDLSGVQVHTGRGADAAARVLSARAFAAGSDVYFARGQYSPGTTGGKRLIAHELSHVAQQASASPAAGAAPRVQRDATNQSLSPGYAEALDDGALLYELQIAEHMLFGGSVDEATATSLSENIALLRDEYWRRDPGQYAQSWARPEDMASYPEPPPAIPEGGEAVHAVGIVAWDREPHLRLRSSPDTSTDDNIIGALPFSLHLQIIKAFPGDWYFVSTASGQMGYASANHIWRDLPEPNARLHRVEAGTRGTAIAIAERFYGDYADDWGQDLRFYVNVLAWANDIDVPDSITGWYHVRFQADDVIWVPSQAFAYSLRGTVSSGSISYEVLDAMGLAEVAERVGQLMSDLRRAISLSGQYMGEAISRHLEQALWNVLEGLAMTLVLAIGILAVTTAIGAIIGNAPGAAAGFEVGLVLLEWLGLAMLIYWVAQALWEAASAFATFFGTVWEARGDEEVIDRAAREFAEAVAILLAKLLEGLVMYAISLGTMRGVEALRGSRVGQAMGETRGGEWLSERVTNVREGNAPIRGPFTERAIPEGEAVTPTVRGNMQDFHALPAERLPQLPQGHHWLRTSQGEWVIVREPGAPVVDIELSLYSDGATINYNARAGDVTLQHEVTTRPTGDSYARGQRRLPEGEMSRTGADNPFRYTDPATGQTWVFDKGHGVDYAVTLEGPGVRNSNLDPANFTPQAPWWNRIARSDLVQAIRGRGNHYREIPIYDAVPPRTANGTPIPREFLFAETDAAGVVSQAWRVPNDPALPLGTNVSQYSIAPSQIPSAAVSSGAGGGGGAGPIMLVPGSVLIIDDGESSE